MRSAVPVRVHVVRSLKVTSNVSVIWKTSVGRLSIKPENGIDERKLENLSWVHWFNEHRLHSHCDHTPPAEFEASFHAAQQPDPITVGNQ